MVLYNKLLELSFFATTIPKYLIQLLKICDIWHYFAAMKLFASIMALVVLALSVMPCADMAATGGKANISYSQNHSGQDQDAPDDCSPFCTCSCCSTSFNLSINSTPAEAIPLFDGRVIIAYNSSKPIEISLPIWQPPQLS